MPKLFSSREKMIFYAVIYIAAFSVLFRFIFVPVMNKNEYLNKEIRASLIKLKKYNRLLKGKQEILNRYQQFFPDYKLAGDEEKQEPLSAALSELQKSAAASNIRIVDIRPQIAAAKKSAQKELVIDMRAQATMEEYLKFIYDIETSASFLNINRLQFMAKPNTQDLEGIFSIAKSLDLD